MQRKPTLTEAQIADLKEAFKVFDIDGNGTISPSELEILMRRVGVLGNHTPLEDQIKAIIRAVDVDNSGTIDFGEFLTLMSDPKFKHPYKDERREAFEMFDKDGNGYISITELKAAFRMLGQWLDDEELDSILKEADLDGDRRIDYEEFLHMMTH